MNTADSDPQPVVALISQPLGYPWAILALPIGENAETVASFTPE
jgi:hypothetical protein